MMKQQISTKTIKRIRTLLKTLTYEETAKTLKTEGFKTPRGKRPTQAFVNYVVSNYM